MKAKPYLTEDEIRRRYHVYYIDLFIKQEFSKIMGDVKAAGLDVPESWHMFDLIEALVELQMDNTDRNGNKPADQLQLLRDQNAEKIAKEKAKKAEVKRLKDEAQQLISKAEGIELGTIDYN